MWRKTDVAALLKAVNKIDHEFQRWSQNDNVGDDSDRSGDDGDGRDDNFGFCSDDEADNCDHDGDKCWHLGPMRGDIALPGPTSSITHILLQT